MEAILTITNQISEFMKHATSTFGSLVVHCFSEKLGFAILCLGWFLLMMVALVGRQNENSTD